MNFEKFKESCMIAAASLLSNPIRSILSIMGVVIGIAAVIAILAIGAGARKRILDKINNMGANSFFVSPLFDKTLARMGELELEDIERIQNLPFVTTALPLLSLYQEVRSRNSSGKALIVGVTDTYIQAKGLNLIQGRPFSPIEWEERSLVCLINEDSQSEIFKDESPIGKSLYFDGYPWEVVGVYSNGKKSSLSSKQKPSSSRMEVLMPVMTLMRNAKKLSIQSIEVQVRPDAADTAMAEIMNTMIREDSKRKTLFAVRDQKDAYAKSLEIQRMLSLMGTVVAGISLLVGGIGMMNVMLTSVAERTREIGIRRAVGARRKDILIQFLVESCLLSGAGGGIGLLLGSALARGFPMLSKDFMSSPPELKPSFLIISVGGGVLLGIIFGFYPAIKASKLSPVEALRTE